MIRPITIVALVAGLAIALGACGSSPSPSSSKASATPTPADALALARAASANMDALDSIHLIGNFKSVTVKNGVSAAETMTGTFDMINPDKMRGELDVTEADGTATHLELISLDKDNAFALVDGAPGWVRMPADIAASMNPGSNNGDALAAARSAKSLGTERVDGVWCDIVEVTLDVAAVENSDAGGDLSGSLKEAFGLGADEIAVALKGAVGTETLWISHSDKLVRREKDDTVVKVVGHGTYEEHDDSMLSGFNVKVTPPIATPSPIFTPDSTITGV
jgi:hypothetical protein